MVPQGKVISGKGHIMANVKPANSAPVTLSNKGGKLTLIVNHGGAEFAIPSGKNKATGKEWTGPRGLVAEVGSRFGAVHIGGGYYLSMYLGKGDEPTAKSAGNLTIES